jgi:hypothetical protein
LGVEVLRQTAAKKILTTPQEKSWALAENEKSFNLQRESSSPRGYSANRTVKEVFAVVLEEIRYRGAPYRRAAMAMEIGRLRDWTTENKVGPMFDGSQACRHYLQPASNDLKSKGERYIDETMANHFESKCCPPQPVKYLLLFDEQIGKISSTDPQ